MERNVLEYILAIPEAWEDYYQARDPLAVIEAIVYIEWLYAKIERIRHDQRERL